MSLTTPARSLAASAAALALAACSHYGAQPAPPAGQSATPSGMPPPMAAACNAQAAQSAVGQNSTSSVIESARKSSGAQMARILRPGQIITKEFDAQRLNVEVDGSGKIIAVRCG